MLFDEGVFGLAKDADEVVLREGFELDANGEAALEFRDQIGRFGDVERSGGDEENVVRLVVGLVMVRL